MHSSILVLVSLLMVISMLTACSGNQNPTPTPLSPTATPTITPTPIEPKVIATDEAPASHAVQSATNSGQPESPLSAPDSPLAPPSPLTPPSPVPTPVASAEGGGLAGQIIVTRPTGDVAVAGLIIGLAEVIQGDDGLPKASGYEASAAPKATTDDYGRFIFNNVKPGMYTLILDAVVTQYQLDDAQTGNTILVDIKPNAIIDLGELRYEQLPIPGFQ